MSIHSTRRVVIGALTAIFTLFWLVPAAHAEEYSYWSLWVTADDQWAPSQTGAGGISLADGSVIGAKYVRTAEALSEADAPKKPATFADLCPNQPAATEGLINVAVVLDFGTSDIAPAGATPPAEEVACEALPADSNGSTALAAAATVTASSDGFITDIDDYPSAAGNGAEAEVSTAEDSGEEEGSTNWAVPIAIAVAASVTVIAATAQMRKRRNEAAKESGDSRRDLTSNQP